MGSMEWVGKQTCSESFLLFGWLTGWMDSGAIHQEEDQRENRLMREN